MQYTKQSTNQQGHQDNYQNSISKSASMPNGGFPVHQNLLPHPPPPPNFYPQQPMMYRERVIDKHIAEKSTSRGESQRQQHQESSGHTQQQQQQVRSASSSGQTQTLNRTIPVRYETAAVSGYTQEQHPTYFYNERQQGGGGCGDGSANYRQQCCDQPTYPPQNVGRHPTRIVN
jgi:hypothetical protein